jgi:hypothetical protein
MKLSNSVSGVNLVGMHIQHAVDPEQLMLLIFPVSPSMLAPMG